MRSTNLAQKASRSTDSSGSYSSRCVSWTSRVHFFLKSRTFTHGTFSFLPPPFAQGMLYSHWSKSSGFLKPYPVFQMRIHWDIRGLIFKFFLKLLKLYFSYWMSLWSNQKIDVQQINAVGSILKTLFDNFGSFLRELNPDSEHYSHQNANFVNGRMHM